MNKIFINMCLLLLAIGWSSCYEDKGNYDYSELSKPIIKGIPENCIAYVNAPLEIPVTLEWPNGELKDVSYEWRVNKQVICREKDLNAVITLDVKPVNYADFSVIDNQTGVRTMKTFKMNITTEFATGWLTISEEADHSELSFIREGDGKLYKNVYETANGEKLPRGITVIKEHWTPWSDKTGEIFIGIPEGPNYSMDLDGNSIKRTFYTKEEFAGGIPDHFAPVNMDCVTNWDYLISNGKLYTRYIEKTFEAQYHDGRFVRLPVPGDYQLSPVTMRGHLMYSQDETIAFDVKTNSYKIISDGQLKNFNYKDDKNKKFKPYDMDKTLLTGSNTSYDMGYGADNYIAFLKGNDGQYYVQQFAYGGFWRKFYYSISEAVFPEPSLIKDDTQWAICQNRPYAYFTSGNDIYAYNFKPINGNTVKKLEGCHFDRPVKAIALNATNYEQLAVAVENKEDPSKCDFMILNVSYVEDGKVIEGTKQEGILGNASLIYYKIGTLLNLPQGY